MIVLLDIIDYYSIIVKVKMKARGFTEFAKITLPLHEYPEHKFFIYNA